MQATEQFILLLPVRLPKRRSLVIFTRLRKSYAIVRYSRTGCILRAPKMCQQVSLSPYLPRGTATPAS